jgi:hypothetical protein
MEVGEAAEQGLSVFNQSNTQIVSSFENITVLLISKMGEKQ